MVALPSRAGCSSDERERTVRRRFRVAASVLALALPLLLGGCRLDAVLTVALERDGGGTLTAALSTDRATLVRAEASGVDPLATLAERVRALPGWRVRTAPSREQGRAVSLSAGFRDAAEFDALVRQFQEALGAPELDPLEFLRLERTGDRVTLRGAAGLVPTAAVTELGWTPQQASAGLAGSVTYQVTVHMPGEVLDTNADMVQERTLIWQVPAGRRVELFAQGTVPRMRLLPLLAGGALAAGATAWWLRRRGRDVAMPPAR